MTRITVGTVVLAAIGLCLPNNLQLVGATFPIVMIPLSASMACRVFRNLKLLEVEEDLQDTQRSNSIVLLEEII